MLSYKYYIFVICSKSIKLFFLVYNSSNIVLFMLESVLGYSENCIKPNLYLNFC